MFSQSIFIPSTPTQNFLGSSVSWILGKALSSVSSISLACRTGSCLWHKIECVYSQMLQTALAQLEGQSFRSWTLNINWNAVNGTNHFCKFLVNLRTHLLQENAWICTEGVSLVDIYLPPFKKLPITQPVGWKTSPSTYTNASKIFFWYCWVLQNILKGIYG